MIFACCYFVISSAMFLSITERRLPHSRPALEASLEPMLSMVELISMGDQRIIYHTSIADELCESSTLWLCLQRMSSRGSNLELPNQYMPCPYVSRIN